MYSPVGFPPLPSSKYRYVQQICQLFNTLEAAYNRCVDYTTTCRLASRCGTCRKSRQAAYAFIMDLVLKYDPPTDYSRCSPLRGKAHLLCDSGEVAHQTGLYNGLRVSLCLSVSLFLSHTLSLFPSLRRQRRSSTRSSSTAHAPSNALLKSLPLIGHFWGRTSEILPEIDLWSGGRRR